MTKIMVEASFTAMRADTEEQSVSRVRSMAHNMISCGHELLAQCENGEMARVYQYIESEPSTE